MDSISGAMLGALLGMRHAGEPDHLAAIGTLVAEERTARGGLRLGAFWGLGHTLSLLAVAVLLTAFQSRLPARVADLFELGVAIMLLALGVRAVVRRCGREARARPRFTRTGRIGTST